MYYSGCSQSSLCQVYSHYILGIDTSSSQGVVKHPSRCSFQSTCPYPTLGRQFNLVTKTASCPSQSAFPLSFLVSHFSSVFPTHGCLPVCFSHLSWFALMPFLSCASHLPTFLPSFQNPPSQACSDRVSLFPQLLTRLSLPAAIDFMGLAFSPSPLPQAPLLLDPLPHPSPTPRPPLPLWGYKSKKEKFHFVRPASETVIHTHSKTTQAGGLVVWSSQLFLVGMGRRCEEGREGKP